MSRKGLTLLEILISALILGAVMLGLMNIFIAAKRHVVLPRSRIQSAELARYFMAPFQMEVRQGDTSATSQDGWNHSNNELRLDPDGVSPRTWTGAADNLNGIDYTPTYTVSDVGGGTGLRRVQVTVNWNENAP